MAGVASVFLIYFVDWYSFGSSFMLHKFSMYAKPCVSKNKIISYISSFSTQMKRMPSRMTLSGILSFLKSSIVMPENAARRSEWELAQIV